MNRTRIKFCGITRVEDARQAAALGVDALGLVFTRRSPRCVTVDEAVDIVHALPPLVSVVALFMDPPAQRVREVEREIRPAWLQFHGSEDDAFCTRFDTPYIKAIGMQPGSERVMQPRDYAGARGFVFDGHGAGDPGGQGKRFDWSRIPADTPGAVILAGGLDADNVAAAIARVRPWAVDVSSGVEASPGIKCPQKMRAFVEAVQSSSECHEPR